jgi:putative membrane protein
MKLLLRWLINAVLILLLAYFVKGIVVSGFFVALVTAVILGLVNALIRPLLLLITLPINILTLGFFTLVLNALLLWLVSSFIQGFTITGFWPAFWGALILSLGSWLTNKFIISKK